MTDLQLASQTVTIASAASLSGAAVTSTRTLLGLRTPAAWTAAAISFEVSADGATYVPLYDNTGAEVSIPAASIATNAARGFSLDPAVFVGWKYVKVRSGLAAAPVAQGADRVITLVSREVA